MPRGLNLMTSLGRPALDIYFSIIVKVPMLLQPYLPKDFNVTEFEYRCKKASLIGKTVETVDIPAGDKVAGKIYFPTGRIKYNSNTVETDFIEGNRKQIKRFLDAYIRAICGDPNTGLQVLEGSMLKTTLTVNQYDGDCTDKNLIDSYTYLGCFPTKLNDQSLELKESAGVMPATITWNFDQII